MGTPGRAKALRALGARKRANRKRIQAGKKPIVGGKQVSASSFTKATGKSVASIKKGPKPGKSQRQPRKAIVQKWGKAAV